MGEPSNIPKPPINLIGKLKALGPGMMIAGAFVGTGTITTSIVAGTEFGYQLLWASVTMAVLLVIILQSMVARITLATNATIAELIRSRLGILVSIIAVLAIFGGNVIYSVGNLNGVALATETLPFPPLVWVLAVTFIYWSLLMIGKFHLLERVVTLLVIIMGLVFIVDMIITQPVYSDVITGLTVPKLSLSQIH